MWVVEQIARISYTAQRELLLLQGEPPPLAWGDAPPWVRESVYAGVTWRLAHRDAPIAAQHEQWLATRWQEGWHYGLIYDADAKLHSWLVPFAALSDSQRASYALFVGIVTACMGEYGLCSMESEGDHG